MNKLQGKSEIISKENNEISLKITELELLIDDLNNHNTLNNSPDTKLTNLEQSNKLLQLRLLGVEEESDEDIKTIVTNILQQKTSFKFGNWLLYKGWR